MLVKVVRNGREEGLEAREGDSLYRALLRAGIPLGAPCGGRCFCGKCKVRVEGGGEVLPRERDFLSPAQIGAGWRLACAVPVTQGLRVTLPDEQNHAIQTDGGVAAPLVRRSAASGCGVAVDIGTTTVAAYLVDLRAGEQLAVASALNAQRSFGADVISRCDAAGSGHLSALSRAIRGQLDELTGELCADAGIRREDIAQVAVAGNTVMIHLLLEKPVDTIAVAPFTPLVTQGFSLPAGALGLDLPAATIQVMPCVAGYVGADTIAAAMACGLDTDGPARLLLDIGTNGEMVLAAKGSLYCCAAAAGPAFEGAHIACGVGGVPGAICQVWLEEGALRVRTIADEAPVGLCGSGLVDAVAALLEAGAVSPTGRLEGGPVTIAAEVHLTQRDIREVQLAKGAIAAGIEILCKEAGVAPADVAQVYLAGGFGNHLNPDSACRVGLLPGATGGAALAVGNAAGSGAKLMLLEEEADRRAEVIRERMTYLELSGRADFQDAFAEHMLFSVSAGLHLN